MLTLIVTGLLAVVPAAAFAKHVTVSSGGVTATLSYKLKVGGVKDLRLRIADRGRLEYNAPITARACAGNTCTPMTKLPLQVVDLYGDGGREVLVRLFTDGASCCEIDQVFTHSSALNAYTFTAQHNFGDAGEHLARIGGHDVFVSGDNAFYCRFSACYESALPAAPYLFVAGRFERLWGGPTSLIRRDAATWWNGYARAHDAALRQSLIAAWAADEWNLGAARHADQVLTAQVSAGRLTSAFVSQLDAFLKKLGYPASMPVAT